MSVNDFKIEMSGFEVVQIQLNVKKMCGTCTCMTYDEPLPGETVPICMLQDNKEVKEYKQSCNHWSLHQGLFDDAFWMVKDDN